ncbi:bifunctional phosphoribosyl-AMP cyclohydrolase/phosphoribosyl-ATP diphosphatase HisIE [Alicyclobacillus fastidiosus]|uniref:Histidine biosynthesis bifunctional protein HisIE n=1 Tax=Alicyclobacillus fastidiosus TaxID=392011 RepID=A0ABV5ADH5_9BACL|nr:bifunctional phosphoribosyl-AMP cyclohydrolase/phosphoribosyl-ATP diphosphatase HisIE [Alicyclobacillus fastidiosus]WEH08691.1 bifunctional phosphoribosyl-AMP cyclohydrolase/phosphoribosyl-ATP diphosphatase HisIE [Alicyclobacillus fastidiosus]
MDLPVTTTVDLSAVRYDSATGLVPVVVQDVDTGHVLTLAYANREALKRTLATGESWFFSRSRQEYWHKGATSGHTQAVVDVRIDCDGDAVLYLVRPNGPACHTGENTCFFRTVSHVETSAARDSSVTAEAANDGQVSSVEAIEEPEDVPADAPRQVGSEPSEVQLADFATLVQLWGLVDERFRTRPEGSYTTYLFTHGAEKIGKKVGEEAVEVALAALRAELTGNAQTLASESADLLYHLLALWRYSEISPVDVFGELDKRR